MSDEREALIKATVLGDDAGLSLSQARGPQEATGSVFSGVGGIEPPYDPETMGQIVENSAIVQPNIEAYKANIDGTGHRLEPEIDLSADDAQDRVVAAIRAEKMRRLPWRIAAAGNELDLFEPTELEIYERTERLRRLIDLETTRLDTFLRYCCKLYSFVTLRLVTRQDLESTGNAYWEIVRDDFNDPQELGHVPSHTIRLMPLDRVFVEVEEMVKISPIQYELRRTYRRFRRFIQTVDGLSTYFKEFGDPRIISKRTGKEYPNVAELKQHDPTDRPATELLHFRIYSSVSAYGVPRWVGAILEVLGARAASEVNWLYFDNKAVPPMAVLVSGGRLRDDAADSIKKHLQTNIKGRANWHSVLVLEAVPQDVKGNPADAAKVRIQLVPLLSAQHRDALFMGYTGQNKGLVREQFRNPPIMVGDSKDYNRATSESAKSFAENQVYALIRAEFDDVINRRLLPELGISTLRFVSNSTLAKDSEVLARIVQGWAESGILTAEEARIFGVDVLGKELPRVDEEWASLPPPIALARERGASMGAGVAQGEEEPPEGIPNLPGPGGDQGGLGRGKSFDPRAEVQRLLAIRQAFVEERGKAATESFQSTHKNGTPAVEEVIQVPQDEFQSWFAE